MGLFLWTSIFIAIVAVNSQNNIESNSILFGICIAIVIVLIWNPEYIVKLKEWLFDLLK
jgi:hypothetical protein